MFDFAREKERRDSYSRPKDRKEIKIGGRHTKREKKERVIIAQIKKSDVRRYKQMEPKAKVDHVG